MKKLSIIIPCYNELKTIRELVKQVEEAPTPGWEKEIIIVDDCSHDGTRDILQGYKSRMKVIYQEKNEGKGTAVQRGLSEATGEYVLIQDADLEYNPAEIKDLLGPVSNGSADIVYGSRNLHHIKRNGFFISRFGVWFITKLINALYRLKLTDVWTCYKLFPRETGTDFTGGHFESELLFTATLARRGYRFAEIAISHNPRSIEEGKKIHYRDGIYAIWVIIFDRFLHLKKKEKRQAKNTKQIVVCPICKKNLLFSEKGYVCAKDGNFHIDMSGRPFLIKGSVYQEESKKHESGINWLKSFLKQFPKVYYGIWHVFCPVLMAQNGPKKILSFLSKDSVILNIGSGPERLGDEFINVDVFPFPEVDVIASARQLPFRDDSIDGIVSESMFEHVFNPNDVAKEAVRVLKPNGLLYVSVPFIHPYHASPNDFTRWTIDGLKNLFEDLEPVKTGVRSGPWSALLMFLAYWLGVIFSFGSKKTAPFIAHIFMIILGPLKYPDFIFAKLPGSEAVSAHLYFIGRKK